MEDWNIIEVLKVGLPGLVFLLSMLSFRLLSTEQEKDIPSPLMLKAIKNFMLVNVFLAIMTLASPIIDGMDAESTEEAGSTGVVENNVFDITVRSGMSQLNSGEAAVCHNADYVNGYLLVSNKKTHKMVQVFASTLTPCTTGSHVILSSADLINLGWELNDDSNTVEVVVALPGYMFADI
mgnify:FL=1